MNLTRLFARLARLKKNVLIILLIVSGVVILLLNNSSQNKSKQLTAQQKTEQALQSNLSTVKKELTGLKNQDQFKRNEELSKRIKSIEATYTTAVKQYERILGVEAKKGKTDELKQLFAKSLTQLSQQNYASSQATLDILAKKIDEEDRKVDTAFSIPQNITSSNTAPSKGYSRQKVSSEVGEFMVDIIAGDLSSTKVIVDTASDTDCANDCPVLSLGDYVSRNGAYAGINGSYFCPASYPTCAGKTNSFDTLLMNKNKKYFNSDNNVYSTVPVAVFGGGWARFMGRSLDWGRDTGVDGVIANQPLLLSGGNIAFGGDGDPKKGSRGSRSFVGTGNGKIYIGVIHNVTVAEMAYTLKNLGLTDALNLDSGGSTALWSGGYKVGPGRNIPNAIIFVSR